MKPSHHYIAQDSNSKTTNDKDSEIFSEVFFGHGRATIASIMRRDVITMDHTKTVEDAAALMTEKNIGCVIINAYDKPFGIVTEKDLIRVVANLGISPKCLILSFLASRPLIYASPIITIQEAASIMKKNGINHLPIVVKDMIVGIVSTRDLAMSLLYA